MDLIHQLKKIKPTNSFDLKILLFYKCDMGCQFCIQNTKDDTGLHQDDVMAKARIAYHAIKKAKEKYVNCTVFGGEMFGDFVDFRIWTAYQSLLLTLSLACTQTGKVLTVTNFTGLNFSKETCLRLSTLMNWCREHRINFKLGISYDLSGRFKDEKTLERFKENEKLLSNYIVKFNTVLTREAIKGIKENGIKDSYFDSLYSKYEFGLRHYWKNQEISLKTVHPAQHLSEQDLYDVYLYIYESYPKADGIQNLLSTIRQDQPIRIHDCPGNRLVILPDNSTMYCINNKDCVNKEFQKKHIETRGCLSCKYFLQCKVDCYSEELDPNIKKMDNCLYKNLLDEIDRREKQRGANESYQD